MIDYARPPESNMYLPPAPPGPPDPSPLDNFNTLKKKCVSYAYANYHSAPVYENYEGEPANAYHSLMQAYSAREHADREGWCYKYVEQWSEDDTTSWIYDTLRYNGINEYDFPFYCFRIPGIALRGLKREQIMQMLSHPTSDNASSRRIGDLIYEKLQQRLGEEMSGGPTLRYVGYDQYPPQEQNIMLDLDSYDNKSASCQEYPEENHAPHAHCDSSDDAEDLFRSSETASPEYSYGSDGSKSGDEEDKRKLSKRPPGRPRGSGRSITKRPRSVSVPEFLRNLLLDPKYCPHIIKWEDHSQGKFRFVKPDEVAKLWGKLKQNDNMTFEKFSRAMRYHYRQSVLVSVPTARLVYQFGHKGPDFRTDNPNFVNIKPELEFNDS